MLKGVGLPGRSHIGGQSGVRSGVALKFGIDRCHPILAATDPTIVKVAAHLLLNRSAAASTVASDLDVPRNFVERIHEWHVLGTPSGQWRRTGSAIEAAFYLAACLAGGVTNVRDVARAAQIPVTSVHNGVKLVMNSGWWTRSADYKYTVQPCRCGSLRLALMKIREPVGTVCLDCETDRAGISWPLHVYAEHMVTPQLWESSEDSSSD